MSNIDPTVPIYQNPTTASVRANFATAKSEIEELQSAAVGAPFLPLAGDVMTGPLMLMHDPVQLNEAATKNYVDNQVAAGSGGTGGVPEAPEDSYTYGRINASWVHVLPIAGGVLTGLLTLSGPPTTALHAATKAYADGFLPLAGGVLMGALTLSGAPTTALMAATKGYVDSSALPVAGGTVTGPIGFSVASILPPGTGALGTDGTRLQLYQRTVGTDPGLGIGTLSGGMFFSCRGASDFFAWFANTAQIANLAGTGTLKPVEPSFGRRPRRRAGQCRTRASAGARRRPGADARRRNQHHNGRKPLQLRRRHALHRGQSRRLFLGQ
jgi:hypothetical protein